MSATIRVGVIGVGRIGKLHAENLASRIPGAQLVAVADVVPEAARENAARWHAAAVADYRALLEDPGVDAVAICSSSDTHATIIQDAAAAGKHIFCEKPLDYDLKKIDDALMAVQAAGVKLQVGFNRRFDVNFRKVREMVAEGKIGTPHILRITSRDPEAPPTPYLQGSGRMFLDMTIHDFDMARFLMDDEVSEIFAGGAVLVESEIGRAGDIDTAVMALRFAKGALGTIDNSRRSAYGYDQRVEVFGSEGIVTVGNNAPDAHVFSDQYGIHAPKPLYFFLERYRESYLVEMQEFINCIRRNTQPPVTGADGRISIVMALAAQRSCEENRAVVLTETAGG